MAHSLPETFAPLLLRWYAAGHRDLPWRQDREPGQTGNKPYTARAFPQKYNLYGRFLKIPGLTET